VRGGERACNAALLAGGTVPWDPCVLSRMYVMYACKVGASCMVALLAGMTVL
jgi:hypothetical protein